MKKNNKYLGMVLPEELHNKLTEMAAKHRVNKSMLVRIAIEMHLESMKDVKPFGTINHG